MEVKEWIKEWTRGVFNRTEDNIYPLNKWTMLYPMMGMILVVTFSYYVFSVNLTLYLSIIGFITFFILFMVGNWKDIKDYYKDKKSGEE